MKSICGRLRLNFKRRERGQVLALTLGIIALASIIIGPFLTMASTSLIGSRGYGQIISTNYACDAGVEHGVWRLVYNGLTATLPNVGDNTTYSLPNQVNEMIPSITVTKTQAGSGGPLGTISQTILDTLEFDVSDGFDTRVIQVSSTVFAIAYRGSGDDGFIKTVEITTSGLITDTVISSYEFDTGTCFEPRIIHISGDIYAVAYRGPGNDGFLKTVTIAAGGQITQATIDTLEYDPADGFEPDIVHVSGDVYAIAYRGTGNDGFLKTVTIAGNGQIGNAVVNSYEFDTSNCLKPDILSIASTVFAISYTGVSSDGFLKTVTIAANGQITQATIDTLEFDTADCAESNIVHVSGDVYAIAYRGSVSDGYLKTASIASNGQIGNTVIDSQVFDSGQGYEPSMVYVGGDVYAIAYRDQSTNGVVKTFEILSDGQITNLPISTLEYNAVDGYTPSLINIAPDVFGIAYRSTNSDGFLTTIGISQTAGGGAAVYSVQSTAGGTTITVSVQIDTGTTKIISWIVQ